MTKRPPKITGIPTVYRGINMRSRTEARWAALLDELGWPWVYEPSDLEFYIPDFISRLDDGALLIEVKGNVVTPEALAEYSKKIEISGWEGEILLVGAVPWELASAQPLIGWFAEPVIVDGEREWTWGDARLFRCLSCNHASVLAAAGSWHCRVCGEGGGNAHVGGFSGADGETLEALWARATNRTQWRPEV